MPLNTQILLGSGLLKTRNIMDRIIVDILSVQSDVNGLKNKLNLVISLAFLGFYGKLGSSANNQSVNFDI